MSEVTIPFLTSSSSDWQAQLHKELKDNTALLHYHSPIEDLSISLTELESPQLKFTQCEPISWKRMVTTSALNEKHSNQLLLAALMQGADAIYIEQTSSQTNFQELLAEIEVAYISCFICFDCEDAYLHFERSADEKHKSHCIVVFRFGQQKNSISSYDAQQIGANCSTQLAAGLFELQQILEHNQNPGTIYFELGVGNEYLIEIAKFRAARVLVAQLEKIHEVQLDLQIIAKTGFCNKSLKDPYTNLLRLSTEGLSAVMGGANALCIQPYDALSSAGASEFGQRMALNIANLLADEAQLSELRDPLQNAYAIEKICLELVHKSWALLCDLDEQPLKATDVLKEQIKQTRLVRTAQFNSGKNTLIGINAFHNEFESPKADWGTIPMAFGLPYLIFEKIAE